MSSQPNNPLLHTQLSSHQVNAQLVPQQQLSRTHQHAFSNSHSPSGNNVVPPSGNGLSQSMLCKNVPKNQLLFDWQSGEVPLSPQRSCRNRHPSSDLYDSASDESVTQDNRHITPVGQPYRGIFSEAALQLHRLRMNGHDPGTAATPSISPSEASSHSVALNNGTSNERSSRNVESNRRSAVDAKKINVPALPDRSQVEHRLSQIQDYIKQTSSLIDSYRLSSGNNAETSGAEGASRLSVPQEARVNGNEHAANAASGATKPTDARKPTEIKIKFEDSLRQLQAEQALLIQKRNEAHEQLQEAQRARNILLSLSSGACPVIGLTENAPNKGSEEHLSDALLNNLQEDARHSSPFRSKIQGVVKGEGSQSSPSREHPSRKRQLTESLPADVTSYLKELLTGDEAKEQASSEDSAVEDAMDEYADARAQVRLQGQIVQDKVAEINALRAQLDQAKSLLNLAHKREATSLPSDNTSADEAAPDQAINIQRQRMEDNNTAALDGSETIKLKPTPKQQLLDQERAKLGRLRGLLATVVEYRSSGLPIPEHILSEFGSEVQSDTLRCASPVCTAGAQAQLHEEDAAAEADAEEDDEPEATTQWNQEHMTLVESASMASELSQGLQQRAAQLQVERDGLAAMQRQLDGLFSQLHLHQSAEKPPETNSRTMSNASSLRASSPQQVRRSNSVQETRRADEAVHRRMEILSDLHNRWQQLQDDIASDGELSVRAAPVVSATQNALNMLASHIHVRNEASEGSAGQIAWEHRQLQGRDQTITASTENVPGSRSQDQNIDGCQMSSAPSTLMRRKSPTQAARNQRAVWSSAHLENSPSSTNSTSGALGYSTLPPDENQPIVSMPSPSPSLLQQQAQEMRTCLEALSHSCQSLCLDSTEGVHAAQALPLMPAMTIAPPQPPPPGSSSHDRESYYQQLLAMGQLQQHQTLLTAVNQCFHMLKMQQHELMNLSNSVHILSSATGHTASVGVHPGVHPGIHPGVHPGVHPSVEAGVGVHQSIHPGVHPGVHPSLLQNEGQWATSSPAPCPPTLNNQVPPGNRTNNYWDNFRSYSRQNLLSTSAKSNEGLPHSPSPLVERSHNSLRSSTPLSVPGPSSMPVASALPQFHSLSTPQCLPGVGPTLAQALADPTSAGLGAVGPVPSAPSAAEHSHTSPLVQNISRKDKRNIDHVDGQTSPRRRPSNEIDHRTASRALEEAALPSNSQMLSPTSQDFEVPSMPILRNSVASLQSRLNQVNLNAAPSFINLQEFIETQNTRPQLNNEGVPFSEISSSLANQQFNEFGGLCSLDHVRENPRRLNMDYHNGSADDEHPNPSVLKRNTGAIKRTYTTSQGSISNAPVYSSNYQRNIHPSSLSYLSSSNSSNNTDNSNASSKLSTAFPMSNSDSESIFKSSKQQSSQDSARNYNCIGRRSGFPEDFQVPCSSTSASSRSRMRGINETDDHPVFRHEDIEYEDSTALRSVGFNNCQSSTSSQSSSSQNTSNVEVHSFGPGKNQLKESCFQIRKCPKYQPKPGARSPLSDTTAVAAAAAVAAVAQNSPAHRNPHRPSQAKSQTGNCQRTVNKNNQDYTVHNQMSGQGQLFEELRESVYAEMTSLISANGSRSHFLVQLLRDLQHISSDSVRQSVLQLVHQAVSRYQIDLSAIGQDGFSLAFEEEVDDEDEARRMDLQMLEKDRLPYAGACSSSDLKTSSTQEGETLMQLVLGLELAAVLSGNSEENCHPALIEDIRSRILQLIPMPHSGSTSNTPASNSSRSGTYLHSQIDNVLDGVFQKFHGRRIGDIRSEMTSCVVSALPIKLMYRSMVDFYSRNNMQETEASIRVDGSGQSCESASSPSIKSVSPTSLSYSQNNSHLSHQDGRDVVMLADASNGDLAEADQSHHTLNTADGDDDSEADRDCSTDGPLSASASESASTLLHVHVYQLGGTSEAIDSEPEVEALQEEGEAMACALVDRSSSRNEPLGAVGGVSVGLNIVEKKCQDNNVTESWIVEPNHERVGDQENDLDKDKEREQGLDQVPTRLACDSDRDQENGEKHRSHHLPMPPNDPSSP